MSVGCIGYAHSRGLGHLVRDFHRNGVIDEVMVVRHPNVPVNEDWYPGAPSVDARAVTGAESSSRMADFCRRHEAMLFFETPFNWSLYEYCKKWGVRAYEVPMYECRPAAAPLPHKFLCPSLLDVDYFRDHPHSFLPLPVDYPWRQRERALHFVHNGGYLGIRYREGTLTLIDAMQYVKSPLRLTIRVQENVPAVYQHLCAMDARVEYVNTPVAYHDLYATGDVAVGAQKWNGCSLPLQEARAGGMLVMNTDRYPVNTWLPRDPLVPVSRYIKGNSIGGPYLKFDEAVVDPRDLAATMDDWYGREIGEYSRTGREWAEQNSWAVLKDRWVEVLKN